MKVGLFNLEPKIENTAMMQVSQFHKEHGDHVEQYSPIFHETYDKIYAFSIFKFTDKRMIRKNMIYGGTGFPIIASRLPTLIEECDLDYSTFPKCKASYIWFSRGCIRQCPFCVVPTKEGKIYPVHPKNTNPNGEYISVMDNNFFANPKCYEAIEWLVDKNQPMEFQQGIDIRLFNEKQGEALKRLKFRKELGIAWDNPRDKTIPEKILKLTKFISKYKIMCFVLIGFWSTPDEDLFRVETLRKLDVDPFVMPYDKADKYQKAFARWVNHKAAFNSVVWKDYVHGQWRGINDQTKIQA